MKTLLAGLGLALVLTLGACGGRNESTDAGKSGDAKSESKAAPEAATAGGYGDTKTAALDANDPNVVKISVPTMQCEMCAEAITNGVKGVEGAQDVKVDVDAKTVFVKVANNTPAMHETIEKAIARTGYSTPTTTRDQAAYDNLPDCCKEGGMKQ